MPQDVSTVDSGNLAGALITLAQALLQLVDSPQTQVQRLEGVVDTADAFGRVLVEPGAATSADGEELASLARAIADEANAAIATGDTTALEALGAALSGVPMAVEPGSDDPGSGREFWRDALLKAVAEVRVTPNADVGAEVQDLVHRISRLADAIDFTFRYDRRQRSVHHWLPAGGRGGAGTGRQRLLRPAGVGSPARQLRGDCQRRGARAPLVSARQARHERAWPRDADVMGWNDVRVPHAPPPDAVVSRHPPRSAAVDASVRRQMDYGANAASHGEFPSRPIR